MNDEEYLKSMLERTASLKHLAEAAIEQVDEEGFFAIPTLESNSIAILVKHLSGNFRSRWTDFLTTDGEKSDRNRDSEFDITPEDTRLALMASWEEGWRDLLGTIESLKGEDLSKAIRIRNREHSVIDALNRQLAHTASHIGQITFLAKYCAGEEWKPLSIPKGESRNYINRHFEQNK